MSPKSPIARGLLSLWFVFHMVTLVVYVWPEGPVFAHDYVHWSQMRQEWNMFRNPGRYATELWSLGVREDGSTVQLMPTNAAPEGLFFHVGYERWTKARATIAYEKNPDRYRLAYARWLCAQVEPDIVGIRLVKHKTKHPKLGRSHRKQRKVLDTIIHEESCP